MGTERIGPIKRSRGEIIAIAAIFGAAVFVLDLATGKQSAFGVLYTVLVLLGLWAPQRSFLVVAASTATLLIIVAIFPDPLSESIYTIVNHAVALVSVWGCAGAVYMYQRAERSLMQSRNTEALYLDMAGGLIVALDLEGRITRINRSGSAILGWDDKDLVGKLWMEIAVPEGSHAQYAPLFGAIPRGDISGVERFESRVISRTGEVRIIIWHFTLFRNEVGEVIGTLGSGADITARRNAEQALWEAKALARLGQLAAIVAHEVRNAMAGINGAISVICERLPAESQERAVAGSIVSRGQSLYRMVEDLLLYARPRSTQLHKCDLFALLRDTRAQLTRDPSAASVDVEIEGQDTTLEVDEEQLKEAFLNLLLNAVQAMDGHGRIRIASDVKNGRCEIAVVDHGPGIPLEVRDKIFEPFFTTKRHGTGLGLPIAKRVIEAHGGDIACEVEGEGGTRMLVRLPLSRS